MSKRAPGFEDYTVSRLEWLVVLLNSLIHYVNPLPGEGIEFAYIPRDDGKTVVLHVKHSADLDPKSLKTLEDEGKSFAMDIAKIYKWDSWINIQTQFNPIEKQTPKT